MITRHGPGNEWSPIENGAPTDCDGCGVCDACGPCSRGHDAKDEDGECRADLWCACGVDDCCIVREDEDACPDCGEDYREEES